MLIFAFHSDKLFPKGIKRDALYPFLTDMWFHRQSHGPQFWMLANECLHRLRLYVLLGLQLYWIDLGGYLSGEWDMVLTHVFAKNKSKHLRAQW